MHGEIGAAAPERAFTIVVTSCGRFDLLRRTLQSLRDHLDAAPSRWIITEDSGQEEVRTLVAELGLTAEIIVNRPALGQIRSIDMAYGLVRTPYVFHCEDDWEFFRTGFIAESFRVLDARADISIVCLRPRAEENKLVRNLPAEDVGGVQVYLLDPKLHPEYFSYAFNPGLRRVADYAAIGPFAPIGHEADISYAFKKAGFRIANLDNPAVTHIGDGRHVADPMQPVRARTPWQKLRRSVQKRIKRLKRALGRE
jgi:hypothetical protein